jgi:prepilin-type processing-associated H-X9-DG protein
MSDLTAGWWTDNGISVPSAPITKATAPHKGEGANFLFVDGSVRWIPSFYRPSDGTYRIFSLNSKVTTVRTGQIQDFH